MNICLDMMGGDYAPLEAVKGIGLYLQQTDSPATLLLAGDEARISALLLEHNIPLSHIKIIHAPEIIGMHESPIKALKEKQRSSIAIGFHLLSSGKADAFCSAGNTGAMMVGTMHTIKTMPGIIRPTISTIVPREDGSTGLLLDVGLNSDCKPEQLNQFALLGSVYAQRILGIADPKVGLINIGEEENKGNLLAQAAWPLLKQNKKINFIGNIEGRDLLLNTADVMVCDGFTGNVILKMAESLYDLAQRQAIDNPFLNRFNFELVGGTPVLGVSMPVIIGHGISGALAFSNMIALAQKMIETEVLAGMKEACA